MMSKCLRVPDEKFRDKVYKTMYENLTTFLRETGEIPTNAALAADLSSRYSILLGEMTPKTLDDELIQKANELLSEMNTHDWLMTNDYRHLGAKQVKIAEGIYVIQKMLKTPGGLIRVTAVNQEGRLNNVHISGDFFFFPATRIIELEKTLENVPVEMIAVTEAVDAFYRRELIESPGVVPSDFGQLITG